MSFATISNFFVSVQLRLVELRIYENIWRLYMGSTFAYLSTETVLKDRKDILKFSLSLAGLSSW